MSLLARRDLLKLGVALTTGASLPRLLCAAERDAAFDWTLHPPESVGMSRNGLEKVRAAIQKSIDDKSIPGAVTAIARHNRLVWYEAQGVRDVDAGTPMGKDDIFRMMSSSKPVVAVAVLILLDEGKLSVDDNVSRFLPTFKDPKVAIGPRGTKDAAKVTLVPAEREITIKDLLTHTSGLMSSGDLNGSPPAALVNKIERKPDDTLADYIPRLGAAALDFQPGTKWSYSPLAGFDVLLRIVEIASGQPADQFLRERIFEPLHMRDTFFNVPPEKQSRVVDIYGPDRTVQKHLLGEGPWTYFSGAGGLFSSVHDYMQLEAMLLNRGTLNGRTLLEPETVALMTRNHVGTLFAEWIPFVTSGHGFGLGVRIVQDAAKGGGRGVGAFGWGGAYGTETWADPTFDLVAALFVQTQPAPANVRNDFERALRKAIVD
ncbi:MAG: serine hydrolase domain-containing protein [Pirellulales bacterium]